MCLSTARLRVRAVLRNDKNAAEMNMADLPSNTFFFYHNKRSWTESLYYTEVLRNIKPKELIPGIKIFKKLFLHADVCRPAQVCINEQT